ncbi:MAG: TIGR03808 family TAT-translocated repetitive protein, partial [Alphaproteobacteria bacterium]
NAINIFRAANVMVRGNRIANCAFSAVRGNAASNLHVEGNSVSNTREVAIYAEFGFEGAVIANNSVDRAAIGISITNFNAGGRLAVVQGNLIRNLLPRRPPGTDPGDSAGVGIAVEADTAVTGNVVENAPSAGIMLGWGHYLRDIAVTGNVVRKADIGIAVSVDTAVTGNVVENAPSAGIMLGWGHYLRDIAVTGNVVRKADIGIAVSVVPGAGTALIANNVISDTLRGAIIGMARATPVTGDLAKAGGEQFAHITLNGNRVR